MIYSLQQGSPGENVSWQIRKLSSSIKLKFLQVDGIFVYNIADCVTN